MAAAEGGLSLEKQRGLWGELYLLRTHLLRALGTSRSVSAWNAPQASHQDFQFTAGAIEVKTTSAKQPQNVQITSERQLDTTGVGTLFLHVIVVDERDVATEGSAEGETLAAIVADLKIRTAADVMALSTLSDRLLDAGWLDSERERYNTRRLTVRTEHTFCVRSGFPCIQESDLAPGVGDVHYALSLAACHPFATTTSEMLATVSV